MSFTLTTPLPPLPHSPPPPGALSRHPGLPIVRVPFLSHGHRVGLGSPEHAAREARSGSNPLSATAAVCYFPDPAPSDCPLGPNSSAWPSSPAPDPAATCFSACPLILSSFSQGPLWPPNSLLCGLLAFSRAVSLTWNALCPCLPRTLLSTAPALSPLTWLAQSWMRLSPLNTQALPLASLVRWQEVGPDLPVLGSDMGRQSLSLRGWRPQTCSAFPGRSFQPHPCCWSSVHSVEGWRVGHRPPPHPIPPAHLSRG